MSDQENTGGSLVATRLSVMMFIQFFIWGAWYTMIGQWLAKVGMADSIGWVYTVGPIAALLSPLFLGMIADRFFSSERVLAALMIIGGLAMLAVPSVAVSCADAWKETVAQIQADGKTVADVYGDGYWGIFPPLIGDHLPFIGLIFLHMLCYMPTLGLTNTIAFQNIGSAEKQFPLIRVFGTIGWIVAGVILGWILKLDETPTPLYVTGIACFALALFSFALPHTPPPAKGSKAGILELLGLRAAGHMLKSPAYLIFILASAAICIPLAAYYAYAQNFINHAGYASAGGVMTLGQISEIIFMLLVPFFFVRLGVKWMLAAGMLAWVARYYLFAEAAPEGIHWMILIGILLHGICYDFFFVTGFIYTENKVDKGIRAQAQGFLVVMTQGIGLGVGAQVMGRVFAKNKSENFDALNAEAAGLREGAAKLLETADGAAPAADAVAKAQEMTEKASDLLLQSVNWQEFWKFSAYFAGAVLVAFVVLFWEKSKSGKAADEGSG